MELPREIGESAPPKVPSGYRPQFRGSPATSLPLQGNTAHTHTHTHVVCMYSEMHHYTQLAPTKPAGVVRSERTERMKSVCADSGN